MKKYNLLSLLILTLIYNISYSQEIRVTEKKFTTLIFSSNILSGVVSSDDYVFEYNEEEPDNVALLKATKKTSQESSLVIKTDNGYVFNINLMYGSEKKNIIQINDSLGIKIKKNKIETKKLDSLKKEDSKIKNSIKENDYTIGNITINDIDKINPECDVCQKMLAKNKSIKRIVDEVYNVTIQLNNIFYKDNKLYFLINIRNESDIDYNLNYIKSYVDTGNDNASTSTQYLEKYPILIFNSNKTIPGQTERLYLFCYDQFTIDNNKKLTFEVNENSGERNLFLKIPHFLINNPKKFK